MKQAIKTTLKDFMSWSLTFTKKLVIACTAVWICSTLYSAIAIVYAIGSVGDFSYLDTFISESSETFRVVVGANLVTKTIENVFHYNNGGIFGTSIPEDNPESTVHSNGGHL